MPGIGLVCTDDCRTRRFLAWLEEPLNEIDARKDRVSLAKKLNARWGEVA